MRQSLREDEDPGAGRPKGAGKGTKPKRKAKAKATLEREAEIEDKELEEEESELRDEIKTGDGDDKKPPARGRGRGRGKGRGKRRAQEPIESDNAKVCKTEGGGNSAGSKGEVEVQDKASEEETGRLAEKKRLLKMGIANDEQKRLMEMGVANYHKVVPVWKAQVEKESAEAGLLDPPEGTSVKPEDPKDSEKEAAAKKKPEDRGNM